MVRPDALAELIGGCRLESLREAETVTAWGVPALEPLATCRIRIGAYWLDEVLASLWQQLSDLSPALPFARLRLQVHLTSKPRLHEPHAWPAWSREHYTVMTRMVGPVRMEPGTAPWGKVGPYPIHRLVEVALDRIRRYQRVTPDDIVVVRCRLRRILYQRKTVRRAMHFGLRQVQDRWLAWYAAPRDVIFVCHRYHRGSWVQVLLLPLDGRGLIAGIPLYRLKLALVVPQEGGYELRVWSQQPVVTPQTTTMLREMLIGTGLCSPEEWSLYADPDPVRRLQRAVGLPRLTLSVEPEPEHDEG